MAANLRRVTQLDVAKAAGVNRATVSLALRKHPGIPERTRTRIEKLAARLGYVPDPMLSALAHYRNQNRPAEFRGTLAWFAETIPALEPWRDISQFTTYLSAAERAAKKLGYQVEVFDVGAMRTSWDRAGAIAKARGINGVLICPQPRSRTHLDAFPWEHFSAVTFGYSLQRPQLHSVTAAHYRGILRIVRELWQRGYRRIGFCFRPDHDARLDHSFVAGYLTSGYLHPEMTLLPPCPDDAHISDGSVLRAWLKENRPDVLITANPRTPEMIKSLNLRVPEELGLVCIGIPYANYLRSCPEISDTPEASPRSRSSKGETVIAGIAEDDERIGELAVDLLVSMIQRGERGIPRKPQRVLFEGDWLEGNTLRPLPPS